MPVYHVPPMAQFPWNGVPDTGEPAAPTLAVCACPEALSRGPSDGAGVVPIQHRPGMEELRNGTGYPLGSIAGIEERRMHSRILGVLVEQVPERKILAAASSGVQRVWRILIGDIRHRKAYHQHTQPLKGGQPKFCLDPVVTTYHCFPSAPTNMPDVQHPGVAVGGK